MKSLRYLSLQGKVLSLEEKKKKLSLFQSYLLFFLFFQICSIQSFIEHKIYTAVRLSTEAKTVVHHYRLQRSQLERHKLLQCTIRVTWAERYSGCYNRHIDRELLNIIERKTNSLLTLYMWISSLDHGSVHKSNIGFKSLKINWVCPKGQCGK